MDGFSELRGGREQLRDELDAAYKRMTDPDEIERQQIKKRRENVTKDMQHDAGL